MTNQIEVNKYEGHAEGEWTIEINDTGDECAINAQDYGTIAQTFYRDSDKLFYATTGLIADAPLLLAEVIRLRKENKIQAKYMDIVQKYDDALLADGDTDPRWSAIYDEGVFE